MVEDFDSVVTTNKTTKGTENEFSQKIREKDLGVGGMRDIEGA